jgi:hypothetical protein
MLKVFLFSPVNLEPASKTTFHSVIEEPTKLNSLLYYDQRSNLNRFLTHFRWHYASQTTSNWSIYTSSTKKKALRASETDEQREARLETVRVHTAQARSSETDEQREARLETVRVHTAQARSSETDEQREARLETVRVHTAQARSSETDDQREARLETNRVRTARSRRTLHTDLNLAAFHYNANYDYSLHPSVIIGKMDKVCSYCGALKFKNETPGMCCVGGKVKLQQLFPPPEPLSAFVSGVTSQSKHFLANIRKYNSCFQMTSFGATNIVRENYMPTFKVQGQIYHRAGSLLPHRTPITNFFKFTSWEILMNKLINVADSIWALKEKLSLHYKLFLINTTI